MNRKKIKSVGCSTTFKDIVPIPYKHEDRHNNHSFKNRAESDSYFIESKFYFPICLLIYLASIFLVDHFGDSLSFQIREAIDNFTNRDKGFHVVKRFLLWDIAVELGFFTIVCTAFTRYPRSFFFFNGFKFSYKESLWSTFFRVLCNCLLTSLVLILLFGILQGFLFWIPKQATAAYLELYRKELGIKWWEQPQYDFFGHGLKLINFSLIFIFLIRIRILLTIIQEIISDIQDSLSISEFTGKQSRPINLFLILIVIFPLIFCAARFSRPQQYQEYKYLKMKEEAKKEKVEKYSYWSRPLNKPKYPWEDKKTKLEPIKLEPASDTEYPRAHITVYDHSTGEITTND